MFCRAGAWKAVPGSCSLARGHPLWKWVGNGEALDSIVVVVRGENEEGEEPVNLGGVVSALWRQQVA